MNRTNWTKRLMAPVLLGLMAAVIGLTIQIRPTLGADFPNADASRTSVSSIILPQGPSGRLNAGIDGTTQVLTLNLEASAAAFHGPTPVSGQALIYSYNFVAKNGVKIERELVTWDQSCTPTTNQVCVTSRAQGGTAKVAHATGSFIKLATQLQTAINATDTAIDVGSNEGFGLPNPNGTIMIDDELLNVNPNGLDWTAVLNAVPVPPNPARGARPAPNALTVAVPHAVGAIVVRPDTYIVSIARQAHDTTTDLLTVRAKAYLLSQPAWPSLAFGQPIPAGTIPFPYDTGASPLLYGYTLGASTNLQGTYNPTTGGIVASTGTGLCYVLAAGPPPTTTVAGQTLQFEKNIATQNIGTFGAVTDTTHSAYTTLTTAIDAVQTGNIEVASTTGFAASGQVMIGTVQADSEMLNYSSVPDGTHLNISARGVSGGTVAVAHPATTSSVIQTPVCDQLATGGVLHVQTLKFGMNADYDSDGDGCSNWNELNNAAGSQTAGGLRDPWNRYDFFDPVPGAITKRQVLVPDILAVVQKYFKGSMDPLPDGGGLSSPDLTSAYDRTALTGGNTWNLGPPDGLQRVPDILAVVKQYFDSCANA